MYTFYYEIESRAEMEIMLWWELLRLKSKRSDARARAVEGLAEVGGARAVDLLITVLKSDGDGRVRDRAANALGQLADMRAVEPLIIALRSDGDPQVRGQAAKALGGLADGRAVEPLIAALGDRAGGSTFIYADNKVVFQEAARALGKFVTHVPCFLSWKP
ncbi:MAG: HEAT repeat domain-containing protein [Bryobacteraceae bacterium]